MKELYSLGLNDNEVKSMIEQCPNIKELVYNEIGTNIEILRNINCNDRHIRNILICNPFYLDRTKEDIINLINKLVQLNISNINLLFDSNPFLLNKDAYEIDDYIKKQLLKGKSLENIVGELESNPYIIDED